jgi:hypothetical protein
MIRKGGKAACPNYRRGCCVFLKILVRKTKINSPLSRRGAGGEALLSPAELYGHIGLTNSQRSEK